MPRQKRPRQSLGLTTALGRKGSNLRQQIQSLLCYHCTTPHR